MVENAAAECSLPLLQRLMAADPTAKLTGFTLVGDDRTVTVTPLEDAASSSSPRGTATGGSNG